MLAYKVLLDGLSPFTRSAWPLPRADGPGAWVETSGPPRLCASGVHACSVDQLPPWLGPELWIVELGGQVVETGTTLISSRGRLVARVAAWDQPAGAAFARACAGRARVVPADRPALRPLLEALDGFATAGLVAAAGYWSAVIAGERAAGRRTGREYDAAFAAERRAQAGWLRSELGL